MDTRRGPCDLRHGVAMNPTNDRLVRPTLPVTCQQPSVGKYIPLDQKRPPGTSAKGVSGTPLLIRARSGAAEASTRRPWMVSSPVVPTVHHGYFWLVEPSGSGVPPLSMPSGGSTVHSAPLPCRWGLPCAAPPPSRRPLSLLHAKAVAGSHGRASAAIRGRPSAASSRPVLNSYKTLNSSNFLSEGIYIHLPIKL